MQCSVMECQALWGLADILSKRSSYELEVQWKAGPSERFPLLAFSAWEHSL